MGLLGKIAKHIAPFGGRMLGLDKGDRKKFKPVQQYWGGSQAESIAADHRYAGQQLAGQKMTDAGVARARQAADNASRAYEGLREDANTQQTIQQVNAANDRSSALASGQNYQAGRGGILRDASKLEGMGDTASRDYQRTSNMAFQQQLAQNQRNALGVAAGRGPAGLRAALAGVTNANADATSQAQITQAQEQNNILGMRQNAYGQAAGIRSNVGAQDLGAMGQYGSQAADERNNALAQQGVQGNAIGGYANVQQNAGALAAQAGTNRTGQYLGAETAKGNAELNAGREYEGQRQQNEKYNYTQDWFPLKRFSGPG